MGKITVADSIAAGQRFGRLVTVSPSPKKHHWNCRCDCGAWSITAIYGLLRGIARSCGCLQREQLRPRPGTHHMSHSPEYRAWSNMKSRCLDPSHRAYRLYGGRGITVCTRWLICFENFYADMGPRPSEKHSLDRADVNGNYEKSNCRWATATTQASNRRTRTPGTHCGRGHEFTPANTIFRGGQSRQCRECTRLHKRAFRARHQLMTKPGDDPATGTATPEV